MGMAEGCSQIALPQNTSLWSLLGLEIHSFRSPSLLFILPGERLLKAKCTCIIGEALSVSRGVTDHSCWCGESMSGTWKKPPPSEGLGLPSAKGAVGLDDLRHHYCLDHSGQIS